jgi:hypothetical protein
MYALKGLDLNIVSQFRFIVELCSGLDKHTGVGEISHNEFTFPIPDRICLSTYSSKVSGVF